MIKTNTLANKILALWFGITSSGCSLPFQKSQDINEAKPKDQSFRTFVTSNNGNAFMERGGKHYIKTMENGEPYIFEITEPNRVVFRDYDGDGNVDLGVEREYPTGKSSYVWCANGDFLNVHETN